MSTFHNLSLRSKLILLVTPALLAFLYLASADLLRHRNQLAQAQEALALMAVKQAADSVTEALQRERGLTVLMLAGAGNNANVNRELTTQRQRTQTTLAEFRQILAQTPLAEGPQVHLRDFLARIEPLASTRSQADQLLLTRAQVIGFYTPLIEHLLTLTQLALAQAPEPELVQLLGSYYNINYAAEMAGRERALTAAMIEQGQFDLALYRQVNSLIGQQQAWLAAASGIAPQTLQAQIPQTQAGNASRTLLATRDELLAVTDGDYPLTALDWFARSSARIDALYDLKQHFLEAAKSASETLNSQAREGLAAYLLAVALVLCAVLILALALIRLLKNQIGALLSSVEHVTREKDLSHRVAIASRDELGRIGGAVNRLFEHFASALLQIDKASVQLAAATEQTSTTASKAAQRTRNQQEQVEQVATATEEMSATSEEISRNTQRVATSISSVSQRSQQGANMVKLNTQKVETLAASVVAVRSVMDELQNRSKEISNIIDVITAVADQTNLLALNAAIEAARAGEQGRGFAVVADEVRTLARQTHDATNEISRIIGDFQSLTQRAHQAVNDSEQLAGESAAGAGELRATFSAIETEVNALNDMAAQIATAAEQQVAVTREIASNMESVNESSLLTLTGSQEITQVTGEQADLARQLQSLAAEFRCH